MTSSSSCPQIGHVHVWYADVRVLRTDPGRRGRARAWLDDAAAARFARYRHDDDREMFLLGRVLARVLVGRAGGVPPTGWRWKDGRHGRPEVDEPGCNVRFNIAHSAGLVACAVAAGRDVGVDLEDRLRRPVDRRLVRRFCSPAEAADIERQGVDWHDRFLTYWTLKEAYLKARGLGIALPLASIELQPTRESATVRFLPPLDDADDRWAFHLAAPTARHFLSVAAPAADGPVTFAVEPFPESWLP